MRALHPCCVRQQLVVTNAKVHAKQTSITMLSNPEHHILKPLSYERCCLAYTPWLKVSYCTASSHQ